MGTCLDKLKGGLKGGKSASIEKKGRGSKYQMDDDNEAGSGDVVVVNNKSNNSEQKSQVGLIKTGK